MRTTDNDDMILATFRARGSWAARLARSLWLRPYGVVYKKLIETDDGVVVELRVRRWAVQAAKVLLWLLVVVLVAAVAYVIAAVVVRAIASG